jgi:hypothetical protein
MRRRKVDAVERCCTLMREQQCCCTATTIELEMNARRVLKDGAHPIPFGEPAPVTMQTLPCKRCERGA